MGVDHPDNGLPFRMPTGVPVSGMAKVANAVAAIPSARDTAALAWTTLCRLNSTPAILAAAARTPGRDTQQLNSRAKGVEVLPIGLTDGRAMR